MNTPRIPQSIRLWAEAEVIRRQNEVRAQLTSDEIRKARMARYIGAGLRRGEARRLVEAVKAGDRA